MKTFDELIAKYGLIVVMMVVVGVIGLALYFWKKDEDTKDAKTISTAGLSAAIIGLFIGLASIAFTAMKEKQPANGAGNNTGSNGEDSFSEA